MSVGQAVGGVVGGTIGFFTPMGPFLGAQLGMMAGGYLDPPKTPLQEGPKLSDLTVQTSTYGAVISRLYGTDAITGNVFWLENNKLKETATKKKSGGKGGGSATATRTYTYSATFAVGLCKGPIVGVRRIWIGPDLFYDAGSSDAGTIVASNAASAYFKVYTGTDTQAPDTRMQATLGVANTPAWRGLAYIVFYDLPLARYGNSLAGAQVRVEVMKVAAIYDYPYTVNQTATYSTNGWSDAAWNGVVFCAVDRTQSAGQKNCATSPDGITWTTYPLPNLAYYWRSVAANPTTGTLIATRDAGPVNVVARSTDNGQTWSTVTLPVTVYTLNVGFGNGVFVVSAAYSADNKMIYSTNDGISWSTATLPHGAGSTSYSTNVHWCSFLGKFFVAYTDPGVATYLASSSTGISWSEITIYQSANWKFITSCNNLLAITGSSSVGILSSSDGSSWTRYTYPTYALSTTEGATNDGSVFVFMNQDNYAYSSDLVNYTVKAIALGDAALWSGLCWSGSCFASLSTSGYTKSIRITRQMVTPGVESLSSIVSAECLQSGLLSAGDIDVTSLTSTVRGYLVANISSIRSALEPLQAAWPFDVRQHGYKIQFLPRGGSAVVTIPSSDLDSRMSSSEPGPQIQSARECDVQLPKRVTVKFLDCDREYEIGSQYCERSTG